MLVEVSPIIISPVIFPSIGNSLTFLRSHHEVNICGLGKMYNYWRASHGSWFGYYFVLSLGSFIFHVAASSGQNSNLFNTGLR